jgi:AcrR family transcriptional regulator
MSKNSPLPAEDLRIRRTKKLIWEALLSLLQEQTFATVSVRAISERAMVHRATFYTHFQDKYALLDYGIREIFQKIARELHREEALEQRTAALLQRLFEYMRAHRELFSLLLVEKGTDSLEALLHCHIVEVMEAELARSSSQVERFAIPVPIIAQFYAGALLTVVTWWVEQEMRVPAEELARYMDRLLSYEPTFRSLRLYF